MSEENKTPAGDNSPENKAPEAKPEQPSVEANTTSGVGATSKKADVDPNALTGEEVLVTNADKVAAETNAKNSAPETPKAAPEAPQAASNSEGIDMGPVNETGAKAAEGVGGATAGTAGEATAAKETAEKAVEKGGNKILAFVGGMKEGLQANWANGKMGKAQVGVGVLMGGHGAFNFVRHSAQMLSSEQGLDKNGEPLPKPGLLNLAFDAAEAGLGAVIATKKFSFGRGA